MSLSSFPFPVLHHGNKKKGPVSNVLKAGLKKEGDGEKLDLGIVCGLYLPLVLLPGSQGFLGAECAQVLALLSGPGIFPRYARFHWSSFMCPPVSSGSWPADRLVTSSSLKTGPCSQWNSPKYCVKVILVCLPFSH